MTKLTKFTVVVEKNCVNRSPPPHTIDKIDKITGCVGAIFGGGHPRIDIIDKMDKIDKITGWVGARIGGPRHPRIDKIDKITGGEGATFWGARHPRIDKIDKIDKIRVGVGARFG